jgi:serine/threonine protein kinase
LIKCPNDGTPLTIVDEAQQAPEVVPGFRIDREIGTGATGKVYIATCLHTSQQAAIKVLHKSLVNDLELIKRFKQEAEWMSKLSSPFIVSIKRYGLVPDGRPFMAMEYIEGSCISAVVSRQGPMSPYRALPIFIQVASGLEHAHANGIVHRDIKPNNIMVTDQKSGSDKVKIVDFGIAKQWLKLEEASILPLTLDGEAIGSPLYMSPEQCLGLKVDHRTDIYSLGAVMYETLTGRQVFPADTAYNIMSKQIHDTPPPMGLPQLPAFAHLERIVLKALAKNPVNRYATVNDLKADLHICLHDLRALIPPNLPAPTEAA